MFRKYTVALLIFAIVFSMFVSPVFASFSDINDANTPLKDAVSFLLDKGITKGISETEFGAEQNVTREQMAAFIYRAVNNGASPEGGENTTSFTDLSDSTFYAYISWANIMGIIKGVSDALFNPEGGITLQDAYTMLVRALGYEKEGALTYPDGYIAKAKEKVIGLNIAADIDYEDELSRGDIAILLYNAFSGKSDNVLDGKKILFVGNSFTYYGKTVLDRWNNVDDETMLQRFDDKGYFYQLCKQNGANVTVTNWTWGGHTLNDIFGGSCAADRGHDGHDHYADFKRLSDMYFDYVVLQPGSSDVPETARASIEMIKPIFTAVNPDVEFIFLIHPRYYLRSNDKDKLLVADIDSIVKDHNLKLVNWGVLVSDIINGNATVEDSKVEYNKNTFIITKSKSDGYHPSMLSGYITTQMVYSALTGESAQGEDYSFCTDETINSKFSVPAFLKSYYTYDNISDENSETKLTGDELTTFPEVFASPTDMLGIQKLIDQYLAK